MFIILLNYVKPLAEVERFVEEHRAFLKQNYDSGHFLLSGRKEPRTGGFILANAANREEITRIIHADPFKRENIAQYEIIEVIPSMAADVFQDLLG